MLYRTVLAALFSMLLWSPAHAGFMIESLEGDFPQEISDAREEDKRLVIMFHQLGCPYCDKMRTRVFPDAKVDAFYSKNFVMVESNIKGNLDIVSPDGKPMSEVRLARKYRVRATPVFLFLDTDGSTALRLTGFLDSELFVRAGRYVTEGVYKTKTSFYKYLKTAQ